MKCRNPRVVGIILIFGRNRYTQLVLWTEQGRKREKAKYHTKKGKPLEKRGVVRSVEFSSAWKRGENEYIWRENIRGGLFTITEFLRAEERREERGQRLKWGLIMKESWEAKGNRGGLKWGQIKWKTTRFRVKHRDVRMKRDELKKEKRQVKESKVLGANHTSTLWNYRLGGEVILALGVMSPSWAGALKALGRDVGERRKKERTSPEWGALCYHGNSADVRACIMWLLIDSVEEWANKTGTITHTQGDGQSSGYTHTSVCTRAHTYTKSTNKSIYIYTWPTYSNGSILNEKKTADDGLEEHFYNQAC